MKLSAKYPTLAEELATARDAAFCAHTSADFTSDNGKLPRELRLVATMISGALDDLDHARELLDREANR